MPHPGKGEHYEDVQIFTGLPFAVASQGDIDVVSEPAVQGDMPASPEVRAGVGKEGLAEVLREGKAQYFCGAYGYGGIRSEVAEYLQGIQAGPEEELIARGIHVAVVDQVHHDGKSRCQDDLQEITVCHADQSVADPLIVEYMLLTKLWQQAGRPLYGARQQYGEERGEGGIGDKRALGLHGSSVDLEDIGQGLEDIEGYPYGKDDIKGLILRHKR